MTFYMTYAGRTYPSDIVPWVEEHEVPIMTNAQDRWSEAREEFLPMFEYDTRRTVDSSGFNSQGDYVDRWGNLKVSESEVEKQKESDTPFFPWDVDKYHDWLESHQDQFEWAATMDYACEDRFEPLWSVEDRIEHTIENTVRQFKMEPSYDLVPVLQGRSVDDYMYCYDQLRDADVDIPLDRVGLGTVCRISSEKRLVEIEQELRERLPDETKIHGFGVKINAFKLGATFDTADSHAWISEPKNKKIALLGRNDDGSLRMNINEHDTARERTLETFKTYYTYVSSIKDGEPAIDPDVLMEQQSRL